MEIRRLGQPELLAALHLTWEVFADEIAPTISPEGVASFQKFIKYDYISQVWQRGNLIFFGAYEGGELCGTLALRPDGHIVLFFVKKQYQGRGVGRMLYGAAYHCCAEMLHAGRMTVNAAPGAVDKYIHMGMRPVGQEQEKDGIRYVPMEMYVNLKMMGKTGQKSKAPWIALGVYALVLVLILSAIGISAVRDFRDESWSYNEPDDYWDSPGDFWDEFEDDMPYEDEVPYGDDQPYEYGGDGYEEEPSGIDAIPEDIAGNLPYEIEDELYTFSDEEKQSMVIEFHVNYPKISGLSDSGTEDKVNKILKARAMETVKRIYEDPVPEIKERVLGEQNPVLISYVEYKVCYASGDLISVAYNDLSYEGGQAYASQHLRTCNISLKNGTAYEVKDIVSLDNRFVDQWLRVMRSETGDDDFLSELDQAEMKKALEGDSREGVYVVNFFLDADGIEIGFDLNYEDGDPNDRGYVWVTAPFTLDEIREYASGSGFWKEIG